MENALKLEGKVAIVTGAGRGIGRAIAVRLAEDGAKVVVNDVQQSAADSTARRIDEDGKQALAVKADVRNENEVRSLFEMAMESFGRIDILVNNAGTRKDAALTSMSAKAWEEAVDTSLKGSFNCCRAAARYMMKQKYGKIVNITSPVPPAVVGKGNANYSAAGSGLAGLTQALALELGPYNINVNCIAPDFIDTEMTRTAARSEGLYLDDLKKFAIAAIALRRLGKPSDVAALAAFLVSDEAGFITGQIINARGGP
jgi:3-oxoacyl-[acyl-carrier protein] reductase